MSRLGLRRVGVGFTAPRGPTNRREEYGLYAFEDEPAPSMVRYAGYREVRPEGEVLIGVALRPEQPLQRIEDVAPAFVDVRLFSGERRLHAWVASSRPLAEDAS